MFQLVVVDDEDKIRRGMTQFVPWSELGFHVAADFADGASALQYVLRNPVDVVLTDIRMDGMSGLELCDRIHKHDKRIQLVILSAHQDFAYAKEALKYQVVAFLTKPTEIQEIKQTFREIYRNLLSRLDEVKKQEQEQLRSLQLLPLLLRNLLNEIVTDFFGSRAELEQAATLRGLSLGYPCVTGVLVFPGSEGDLAAINTIFKAFRKNWDEGDENSVSWSHPLGSRELFFAVLGIEGQESKQFLDQVRNRIEQAISDFSLVFGQALMVENLTSWATVSDWFDHRKDLVRMAASPTWQNFLESIDEVISSTQELLPSLKDQLTSLDLEQQKSLLLSLNDRVQNYYLQFQIQDPLLSSAEAQTTRNRIDRVQSPFEALTLAESLVGTFDQVRLKYRSQVDKIVVDRVKSHILARFSQDISLADAAQIAGLNPAYFSRLFKQKTGMNFIDYLTKIRMDQAKTLLQKRELTIAEVSRKVGYKSDKYFIKVFRKMVGYTPKDFSRIEGRETRP